MLQFSVTFNIVLELLVNVVSQEIWKTGINIGKNKKLSLYTNVMTIYLEYLRFRSGR